MSTSTSTSSEARYIIGKIANNFDETVKDIDIANFLRQEVAKREGEKREGELETVLLLAREFYNPNLFGRVDFFWMDQFDISIPKFYRLVKGLEYNKIISFYFYITRAFYILDVNVASIVKEYDYSPFIFSRLVSFIEEAEKLSIKNKTEEILEKAVSSSLVELIYDYIE